MPNEPFRTLEMTRRIRDLHHAILAGKTPEERIAFYDERARALLERLGVDDAGGAGSGTRPRRVVGE